MSRRRWDVGLVTALVLVAFGLLLAEPALVTAAVIGIAYALFGSFSSLPERSRLRATREFQVAGFEPGQPVTVTLRVENVGNSVIPDVRVADGVPDELGVVDGSARGAGALSPGETLTIQYTLVLQRGRFEFEQPIARLRSLAGSDQRTVELPASGESSLTCANSVTSSPLADATLRHAGTVPTDAGGSGLEFYSTRQYHHGDPMSRINWHQVAKTGEFVTVQYRQERAIRTVIVVDCRPVTRVTPWAGYPTGGALAAYAAERLYDSLQADGVVTSLTAVGLDDELPHLTGPDGLPWIDPGSPDGSSTALFRGTHRAATGNPQGISLDPPAMTVDSAGTASVRPRADGGNADPDRTERLLSRLPADAQIVVCSPVLDNWPVELGRELSRRGYPCVLISPNATAGMGYGQRIGAIQRRLRLSQLRQAGVDVTDWPIEQPVEYALQYTLSQL